MSDFARFLDATTGDRHAARLPLVDDEPRKLPAAAPGGLLAVGGVATRPPSVGAGPALRDPPTDPQKQPLGADLPATKAEAEQVATRTGDQKLGVRLVTGVEASAERMLAELPKARGALGDAAFRSVIQVDSKLFEAERDGRERGGAGALDPMVMSGLVPAGANRPGAAS
jgi:hypothetical protein